MSRNRPSNALYFCIARLVQIFIHFIITDTLFTMTFIFIICVSPLLQLLHYMFCCWCYCYSILLAVGVGEKW